MRHTKTNTKFLAGTALAAALLAGGAGVALAGSSDAPTAPNRVDQAAAEQAVETDEGADDDDAEQPITGTALDQAAAAALEQFPDGTVTDTEVGDEEGYYEVEVTLPGGDQVDVHLDEQFNPLGTESDAGETDDD